MITCAAVDAPPPAAHVENASPEEPPAYVYAATDYRPRQSREIELCQKAAGFDWLYTGTALVGVAGSVALETQKLKHNEEPGVRLIGPGMVGFFWGMFLSGGYLSLPKCDPTWSYGAPPEGPVRKPWPIATAITLLATVTAPAIDFAFLGAVKPEITDGERVAHLFLAAGFGTIGSLFPYLLPPKTWTAKKEIERIRLGQVAGGPFISYGFAF